MLQLFSTDRAALGFVLAFFVFACSSPPHKQPSASGQLTPKKIEQHAEGSWVPILSGKRIAGRVRGQSVEIVLDTGASLSAIDETQAKKLGLSSTKNRAVHGAGGTVNAKYVSDLVFELGQLQLPVVGAVIVDLSLARKKDQEPPIIVGYEIFRNSVVEFDFARNRAAFHDPKSFVPPKGVVVVPITPLEHGQAGIPVNVGGISRLFLLDTGSETAIDLHTSHPKASDIMKTQRTSTSVFGGVGGIRTAKVATAPSATWRQPETALRSVPIQIYEAADIHEHQKLGGVVGLDALRQFHVIIDYPNFSVYLLEKTGASFIKNRVGLQYRWNGNEYEVIHVAKGSPAEKANWKVGQRIRSVNGRPVGDVPDWRDQPVGTTVEITNGDGSKTSLQLRDYY